MILAEAMANCPTGAAEYRDRVPFLDVGEISAEPASREDIAHQDCLVVADLVGQLDEAA
jgi:hypothetical protein